MPMTPELQKDYDYILENLKKAPKDRTFFMNFPFPDEKSIQDFLAAAEKNGVTKLGFSACDRFGANRTAWLANNLSFIPSLNELCLNECEIGLKGATALFKALPQTHLKKLSLERNEISDKLSEPFLHMVQNTPLTSLSIAYCTKLKGALYDLADILPSTKIESLNVSYLYCNPAYLIEKLTQTKVNDLNIKGNNLTQCGELLAETLPKTKLTSFHMDGWDIPEPDMIKVLRSIPQTDITSIGIVASKKYSEEFYKETAKMLLTPSCRVEKPNFGMYGSGDLSKPYYEARDILKKNIVYRQAIKMKMEKNKDVTEVNPSLSLSDALEEGLFVQALAAHPQLKASDCLASDPDNSTLKDKAVRAELLPVLFNSKNWDNAKEMQMVWEAIPQEHHWQMDGKKGRPSYQAEKNKVMKKAVTALFAAKAKQGLGK